LDYNKILHKGRGAVTIITGHFSGRPTIGAGCRSAIGAGHCFAI